MSNWNSSLTKMPENQNYLTLSVLQELKLKELLPSAEYDALGSTAAELDRRKAINELNLW